MQINHNFLLALPLKQIYRCTDVHHKSHNIFSVVILVLNLSRFPHLLVFCKALLIQIAQDESRRKKITFENQICAQFSPLCHPTVTAEVEASTVAFGFL